MRAAERAYTGDDTDADGVPFTGGLANVGRVVRVGATVRRPAGPHSPALHALLDHLEAVGFDGAPRFLGVDARGRSVLTHVDGEVGHAPYPGWIAGAETIVSVAELLRRFHDAVATFVPPADAAWDTTLAPDGPADGTTPGGGAGPAVHRTLIGHNDVSVENVVCRDGRAVALIDFDFAAPTDPLWDVAVALRHWVPVRDPADLDDARSDVDQVARYRAFAAVYGVDAGERQRLVALGLHFLDRAHEQMRVRAEAGLPGYVEAWRAGYAAQNRRSHAWLTAHAAALTPG